MAGVFIDIEVSPEMSADAALAAIHCDWALGKPLRRGVVARPGVRYRWEDADLRHALQRLRERRFADAARALRPHRDVAHAYFGLTDPLPLAARAIALARARSAARRVAQVESPAPAREPEPTHR